MSEQNPSDVPRRLKELRKGAKLTLRQLCEKSGVAPSYLSNLEHGGSSPTLATLHKILHALGTDLETFFTQARSSDIEGRVFRRSDMQTATDQARRYTFLLPRRKDVKVEMLDEYFLPGEGEPDFEVLECDIAGAVLSGTLQLEIGEEEKRLLIPGDAFYIPAEKRHRGRCLSSEPVHLITVFVPPKY